MNSSIPNNLIYLDYNATHPPFADIYQSVEKEYTEEFYNPSGMTRFSLKNQGKIESARKYFSQITGFIEKDLVFSSTGTESNYLLLSAIAKEWGKSASPIVSPFEHPSVFSAVEHFFGDFRIIRTNRNGILDDIHLQNLLEEKKAPLIISLVGNETGVVQDADFLQNLTKVYQTKWYSDLMQAFGKIEVPFDALAGFSFSGHKIGAGMGAALTGFKGLPENVSIFSGGNQENNHRAGTENWPAILRMKLASERTLSQLQTKNEILRGFQKKIEETFESMGAEIISKDQKRVPNTSFILLPIEAVDFFLMGLEERQILVSTGSSCKSRSREASRSLLAMQYSEEEALRCIRVSTGIFSKEEEIETFLRSSQEILERLS
ncbi:aminotransferase, class V [Leptospira ryugenii]|uniref:Aminotransferase, class V n=1 Tax=Leptospira ryugenii TaxID=1917863 RepID=A0A2P2DVR2_9LEPT|nr:aminotransferase class V-fold PLP-dependent enzyme [Leptospira ryugenii]GBF48728.1 aminotransferase, class V [Leptospira ryugenii]